MSWAWCPGTSNFQADDRGHTEPAWNLEPCVVGNTRRRGRQASELDFMDRPQVILRFHLEDRINGADVEATAGEAFRSTVECAGMIGNI
jgi:hypothetical protein